MIKIYCHATSFFEDLPIALWFWCSWSLVDLLRGGSCGGRRGGSLSSLAGRRACGCLLLSVPLKFRSWASDQLIPFSWYLYIQLPGCSFLVVRVFFRTLCILLADDENGVTLAVQLGSRTYTDSTRSDPIRDDL